MNPNEDIDPATLEIFKTVLESPSGRRWMNEYIMNIFGRSHFVFRSTDENGVQGYIKSYGHPSIKDYAIHIRKEDSWLKKWIKRQLM